MVNLTKTGQEKRHQIKHKVSLRKESDNMKSINNIDNNINDNIYTEEINDINRNQNSRINNRGQPETENSKSKNYDGVISWLILLLIICFVMLIDIIYQLWQFGYKSISIGIGIISVVSVIALIVNIKYANCKNVISKEKSFKDNIQLCKNLKYGNYIIDSINNILINISIEKSSLWFSNNNLDDTHIAKLNITGDIKIIKDFKAWKYMFYNVFDLIIILLYPILFLNVENKKTDLDWIPSNEYYNKLEKYNLSILIQMLSCSNLKEFNNCNNFINEKQKTGISESNIKFIFLDKNMETALYWLYNIFSMTVDFKDISSLSIKEKNILFKNQLHKLRLLNIYQYDFEIEDKKDLNFYVNHMIEDKKYGYLCEYCEFDINCFKDIEANPLTITEYILYLNNLKTKAQIIENKVQKLPSKNYTISKFGINYNILEFEKLKEPTLYTEEWIKCVFNLKDYVSNHLSLYSFIKNILKNRDDIYSHKLSCFGIIENSISLKRYLLLASINNFIVIPANEKNIIELRYINNTYTYEIDISNNYNIIDIKDFIHSKFTINYDVLYGFTIGLKKHIYSLTGKTYYSINDYYKIFSNNDKIIYYDNIDLDSLYF